MKRVKIDSLLNDKTLFLEFNSSMANGAVAILPTDTLYGFAADSSSKDAVRKIYEIKGRDEQKPFILFMDKMERIKEINLQFPEVWVPGLLEIWPGALTAIVDIKKKCDDLKAFDFSSIGVRIPDHQKLLSLLGIYSGFFLTTSANRSDQGNIFNPDELQKEFESEVDWLIDDGVLKNSKASTVVRLLPDSAQVLRQGAVEFNVNLPQLL